MLRAIGCCVNSAEFHGVETGERAHARPRGALLRRTMRLMAEAADSRVLRADWVLPVCGPPIGNGAVRIEGGRIAAVGGADEVFRREDCVEDLGRVALLPGLVNAHAHLELSVYAGRLPPSSLWDWLPRLIELRREAEPARNEVDAASRAAWDCLSAGVTCIGDISRNGRVFAALDDVPIRQVRFLELISGAAEPPRDPDELGLALDAMGASADASRPSGRNWGVSPHSPYTVTARHLDAVVRLAVERRLPLTMHVAETMEEREWLEHRTGRLAEFVARHPASNVERMFKGDVLGLLERMSHVAAGSGVCVVRKAARESAEERPAGDDAIVTAGSRSRRTAAPMVFAHCNYVRDDEIAWLGARSWKRRSGRGISVVFCPRAHRFFGHRDHPWRRMLAAGVNVCLGSDSLASNESLSILDELRFLRRIAPECPAATLLEMATHNGAAALGLRDEIGAIRVGLAADLIAIPLLSDCGGDEFDPAAAILDGGEHVSHVYVGGVRRQITG